MSAGSASQLTTCSQLALSAANRCPAGPRDCARRSAPALHGVSGVIVGGIVSLLQLNVNRRAALVPLKGIAGLQSPTTLLTLHLLGEGPRSR
jgi:hypothetical protein